MGQTSFRNSVNCLRTTEVVRRGGSCVQSMHPTCNCEQAQGTLVCNARLHRCVIMAPALEISFFFNLVLQQLSQSLLIPMEAIDWLNVGGQVRTIQQRTCMGHARQHSERHSLIISHHSLHGTRKTALQLRFTSHHSFHDPRRKAVPDCALPSTTPPPKGLSAGLLPEPFHAARALLPGVRTTRWLCSCSRLLSSP